MDSNIDTFIMQLPELNSMGLYYLLKNKKFKIEGKVFRKENITGKEFIAIMSSYHGLPILEEDLGFSKDTVDKLKTLYLGIYKQRRETLKQFLENERPFYWF